MRYCITFLLLLLLISPALTVQFSAGENLKITDEKPLNDDFMLAGNTVKIEQEINGDLFIAAKTAVVDRVVRGSLHIAAGTITLRAPINGSLYIAGGNVTVDAPVGRNVVVAGGKVIIGPAANIARDLAIAGGEITVAGLINRDVIANGGTLKIARTAIIGRNLRAKVESAQIDAAARVSGQKNIVITPTQKMKKNKFSPVAYMMMVLFCSICLLVAGLFLVGLSPKFTSEVVSTLQTRPWVSLLLGLILVVIAPLIFIILLFLLPLAFIFLSLETDDPLPGTDICCYFAGEIAFACKSNRTLCCTITGHWPAFPGAINSGIRDVDNDCRRSARNRSPAADAIYQRSSSK